jgi:hypothetical protein
VTEEKKAPYDPRLREAMDEIKAVCKKYDIGAQVILASESHVEFLAELTPTWSVCSWEQGGRGIRFKSTNIVDKEEKKRRVEASCHMILATRDMLVNHYNMYAQLAEVLAKHLDIEHKSLIGREPDSCGRPV